MHDIPPTIFGKNCEEDLKIREEYLSWKITLGTVESQTRWTSPMDKTSLRSALGKWLDKYVLEPLLERGAARADSGS